MRNAYDKLYIVDSQGIRNTTYWRKSALTSICAPFVLEMEHNQEFTGAVDEFIRFEEARIAFKKYRKYHCALFEYAAMWSQICFGSSITEAVDYFKLHVIMQNMRTMELLRGLDSKTEGRLKLHQNWSS